MNSRVMRTQYPQVRARALLHAEEQAKDLLATAHAQADALRRAAEEEYETWRAQAVREAEDQVAAETRVAQLASLARESPALADLREAAVPLVMRATEKLVRTTFDARPELVQSVILDAARHLKLAKALEVEVHPDDVGLAETLGDTDRPLSVRAAPDLERGECRVLSDVGAVDARFTTQLDALARALRGALTHAPKADT